LSDPSVSVSVGLTAEEQAQMNEKPKETHKSPEQIRAEWGKFLTDSGVGESTFHFFLGSEEKFLDSMEIHEDGAVSLTGDMWLDKYIEKTPIFPTKIRELRGSLYLPYLISAEHLILPVTIDRVLALPGLTTAKYLALPKLVRNTILFGKKKLPQSDFDALRASRPDLADKMKLE
ncbi:MAG: hypothetical protein KBC02_00005, partial [Candidatus Pacebacteria bacterium]|nr:hypothetical protein [Candidatus Paceibacterota bacterium]